jgi:hypothetical protein
MVVKEFIAKIYKYQLHSSHLNGWYISGYIFLQLMH